MKVYVILYDGKLSSGGYTDVRDAIQYCDDRGIQQIGWNWIDEHKRYYQIVEVCTDYKCINHCLGELKAKLVEEFDSVGVRMDAIHDHNLERWLNLMHYRNGLRFALDRLEEVAKQ